MGGIERAVKRTRQRLMLGQALAAWGWAALAGLGAALLLVLVDRLSEAAVPLWSYAVLAALVVLAGPTIGWWYRPDEHTAAARLDARLGLKDRVATALHAKRLASPLAEAVVIDAKRAAAKASVRAATPLTGGRGWRYAGPAAGLVALLGVFLPHQPGWLTGEQAERQRQQAESEEAEATRQQIVEAKTSIEQTQEDGSDDTSQQGELMQRLASLTDRELSSPEEREQAAAELSSVQDRLEQMQQAKERQVRSMENALSRVDPGESGPADRFAEALRRGDYEAARQHLEQMAERVENGDYSPEEKEKLKRQLEQMSQQLEQLAEQAQQQQKKAQERIENQLSDAGLSQQQIDELAEGGYDQQAVQEAVEQSLQQQGMDQQQAREQAQETAEQTQQQQQQANEAGDRGGRCEGLGSSLGRMSQSLSEQQGKPGGQQGQQGQPGSSFQEGAYAAQQQVQQMQQAEGEAQKLNQAQSQLQQAMQRASGGQQGQQGQRQAGQRSSGGGRGGQQAGTAEGGDPSGESRQAYDYNTRSERDIKQGQGRVIASWQEEGQAMAGEAELEYDQSVEAAQQGAERAVTEDRVPRRYHGPVRDYFNQLPDTPDQSRGAPAAPE